ncbi:DUF2312 domain-containing protein [uncultured Brevundimonas sp.]|uniref:DUF2312 domain-containing protein n=1 Tax=uncultured Brevundimonas sp. TaxID=213418 RepID=UPI0025F33110|nr:DUF2312 domain-containing protein [uncultured Brevundimonas sp.]
MTLGHNTVSGKQLATVIDRVEAIRAAKQTMSDDESAVLAEAKLNGFVPAAIRHVVKLRAMKPHARQEAEALVESYLHALGMAADTPLFRQVGLMSVDIASRDQVTEAMKKLVPENGSIIIEVGGKAIKLTRDKDGKVDVRDHVDAPAPMRGAPGGGGRPMPSPAPKADVPDVDAEGAEALGRQAFKDNEPIIGNPFPFGDSRRGRWDSGWRKESGTDGMGPDD